MKKSIVYLGVALIAFSNVSFASNEISPKTNFTTFYNVTPLCVAISKGEIEIVKKFIEYGASVNEKSNGMTPLMVAARYNNAEIINYLISKGADVKVKDEKGYTALKYAELSGATKAIEVLKNA